MQVLFALDDGGVECLRLMLLIDCRVWVHAPVHGELLIQAATGSSNKPRQWRCQR